MPDGNWGWVPDRFETTARTRPDGSILLTPTAELSPYPERATDPLEDWATRTPYRVLVARRDERGGWVSVTYGEAVERVRALAAGLTGLGLSAERPLLILSGNGIEHLLLGLAAMYAGAPYCPVSPAYSRAGSDLSRLRYVVELLTPGLVASFDEVQTRAIETIVPANVPVLCNADLDSGHRRLSLTELENGDTLAAERAHATVGADTIAKFLLTSGSTGRSKPVITTHRMLSCNQLMLRQALPFVVDDPPVLVDWLPWNHTFGGSHNVGLVFFNGGTLYIDDGQPVPGAFETTLENLREISPTVYFNVPKGFDLLAHALDDDDSLRRSFFQHLKTCFFAGASLAQHTWDALDKAARREHGRRVPILSGLGATETAPAITFTTPDNDRAGVIGLPAAGNDVKLAPVAGKLELRVRGPHVTPGYWRLPEQTMAAFDDEGYYRLGDAVRLVDPDDATRGMIFDGRLSDDFKLASGTWVRVGPLRDSLVAALAPIAQDVVIAGLDRDYVGALIIPDLAGCRRIAGADSGASAADVLASPVLCARIVAELRAHAVQHPGSSQQARRAIVLVEPLSVERGELTDKGSVNRSVLLRAREALVADLFADPPPAHVLLA